MYPPAYIEFLIEFHSSRDYFECHEILEEHWKEEEKKERKLHWVGLIQLAVALYHERRGNSVGAKRMYHSSLRIIQVESIPLRKLAIDVDELAQLLSTRLVNLDRPFEDLSIPLTDQDLINKCQKLSQSRDLTWGHPSQLLLDPLIHKHRLRDRTDVINERQQRLLEKKKK
ncbi:DUF309 domain-containing protein [Bacillus sp. FJAT-45037]|uniref:DUF309 domain-containing protein n=1 Tax=Bacillus sp. FJAT-45037 TaxID=2011007 RepID=UPI000C246EF0|nr:DUF309 domain-containing protein [Bacillus sp. FJAT-45037]